MFKQYTDPLTGVVNPGMVIYTDPDGQVWTVPENHRIWTDIYLPWLAAGNTLATS